MENDLNEIGQLFMTRSRYHLSQDFLPKIERCVELLKDEQIWWRANPQSNSIGNLILHLSGNVRQWIVSGLGGAADSRDRGAEFAQRDVISREELIEKLKQQPGFMFHVSYEDAGGFVVAECGRRRSSTTPGSTET